MKKNIFTALLLMCNILVSCRWNLYSRTFYGEKLYEPHQILIQDSSENMTISDITIYRRYHSQKMKSSGDVSLTVDFDTENKYEYPNIQYFLYVNDKLKSKGLFNTLNPFNSGLCIKKGRNHKVIFLNHHKFEEDTIRLVFANKKNHEKFMDASFIIDEKDSIPNSYCRLLISNHTNEIAYVGVAGKQKYTDKLVYITDGVIPSHLASNYDVTSPVMIKVKTQNIHHKDWEHCFGDNLDTLSVVLFKSMEEMKEWKNNPIINSSQVYNFSLDDLGRQEYTYHMFIINDMKKVLIP